MRAQQTVLANMTQQMRKVVAHLVNFVSKSLTLYEELNDLISFELLVNPLNAVLTELIDNGVTASAIAKVNQISSVEVQSIHMTLNGLHDEFPTLPLDEGNSNICQE